MSTEKDVNIEETKEAIKEETETAKEDIVEIKREIYKVTPDLLEKANTYIPLNAKIGFASIIADKCFDRVEISASENDNVLALPSMYKENTQKKARYMMGALVKMYFCLDFEYEKDDKFLMTDAEYDKWAGGHILNQLERFKSDMAIRDICFDILQDYRDLEKRVNTEIYSLLQIANEPVGRIMAMLQMSVTPEATQGLLSQLEEMQQEIENYQASKPNNIIGTIGKEDYE